MYRADPAGRETIAGGRPRRIVAELPLAEIDDIEPAIGRRHPDQAGSIAVNRNRAVVAEAGRIGVIMSKVAREAFGPPVEVEEAGARRHPESVSGIVEKRAAVEYGGAAAQGVFDDACRLALILDQ